MLSQKSNEPTKTKKAMKQTMKYLSIAALVVVGANMMSCNKVELSTEQLQEDKTTSNVVTLTTTISLDGGATTRALTSGGVKTFAAGETIALVYKKTGGATAVAVSDALKDDGDIASGAKSATFTFTLEDPDNTKNVSYVYPAAMAKADGYIDYDALDTQDGTLTSLASNLDLATYTAAWNGTALPNVTLDNQLAILALTLKDNAATPSEITSDITGMTVSDGTNTYTITRSAAAGPIYVAIQPTTSADIEVTATDGTKNYTKSLTGKTYEAGNGYSVSWRMAEAAPAYTLLSAATTADHGKVVCADGHLHDAKTAVPDGCTAVGILGKVTETGHGLILSLQNATNQNWNTINGWTSETTYAGTTLKVLPDDAARGSLTSYTKLGATAVSNWAVAQKSDYEAIFTNLGSTTGDEDGITYDANVNAYITTGVGGTAISGDNWSATERNDSNAWRCNSSLWVDYSKTSSRRVRPVLAF